jgi:hypothetical protein
MPLAKLENATPEILTEYAEEHSSETLVLSGSRPRKDYLKTSQEAKPFLEGIPLEDQLKICIACTFFE